MFGIFAKQKETLETNSDNTKVLEDEIENKNKLILQLKEQLEEEKTKNQYLDDKLKSLQWKLDEEKENNAKLNDDELKERHKELLNLFGFENISLLDSLSDIQDSISNSTQRAKDSLVLSDKVDDNFSSSFKDIGEIVVNLDELLRKSHMVANVIDDLSKKAVDIEKSIVQINEVVMQINILSLNASVEAASAGDAGKGFAVVASEVKNLANKTSSVASNIEKTVKMIQNSIKQTNSEFKDIDSTISNIHSSTTRYDGKIKSLHILTKNSLKELSSLSDSVFMNLAKIDHVIWKVNTYKSVYDRKPSFKFVNHENCRLGKWYIDGDGIKYFSKAPSYHKLDNPHAAVHDTTSKIFDLVKKDEKEINYKRIKYTFEYMEKNSQEVFNILDKILEETI